MITYVVQGIIVGLIVWIAFSIEEYLTFVHGGSYSLKDIIEVEYVAFTVILFSLIGAFVGAVYWAVAA